MQYYLASTFTCVTVLLQNETLISITNVFCKTNRQGINQCMFGLVFYNFVGQT